MAGLYNRGATPVRRAAGGKQFKDRDPTKVWADGGKLESHLDRFEQQLTAALSDFKKSLNGYAGEQALEAVQEYVEAGEFGVVMINGEPNVSFRVYDDTSEGILAYAALEDLLGAAKDEAEEDRDDDMLAALRRLGALIGPEVKIPDDIPLGSRAPKARGRVKARVQ